MATANILIQFPNERYFAVDCDLGLTDLVILLAPISGGSFYQLLAGRASGAPCQISHPRSMTGEEQDVPSRAPPTDGRLAGYPQELIWQAVDSPRLRSLELAELLNLSTQLPLNSKSRFPYTLVLQKFAAHNQSNAQ
ncbi:MAG: hypothetical protein CVU90_05695 [Firmicutes bacterium HGW-Firmicutes-15]|nr:MAG: hypothetical protein CVU90_05695 [Firmicutes bacterium HGW-Firmicutes-15]